MGRGDALSSNISSPSYLPALVVSLDDDSENTSGIVAALLCQGLPVAAPYREGWLPRGIFDRSMVTDLPGLGARIASSLMLKSVIMLKYVSVSVLWSVGRSCASPLMIFSQGSRVARRGGPRPPRRRIMLKLESTRYWCIRPVEPGHKKFVTCNCEKEFGQTRSEELNPL